MFNISSNMKGDNKKTLENFLSDHRDGSRLEVEHDESLNETWRDRVNVSGLIVLWDTFAHEIKKVGTFIWRLCVDTCEILGFINSNSISLICMDKAKNTHFECENVHGQATNIKIQSKCVFAFQVPSTKYHYQNQSNCKFWSMQCLVACGDIAKENSFTIFVGKMQTCANCLPIKMQASVFKKCAWILHIFILNFAFFSCFTLFLLLSNSICCMPKQQ